MSPENPASNGRANAAVPQETGRAESPGDKPKRAKVTVYLPTDVDVRLRRIQLARYEKTGSRPDLSELVEEAVRKLEA